MRRKICFILIVGILLTACACRVQPEREREQGTAVTDLLGRTVTVPKADAIRRVACIGAGALRLYAYVGDLEKLCGVEACEYGYLISARPYQMVNEKLFASLPSIGAGGPSGTPDAERLLAARPDVIFSLYTADASEMDELQEKTGIPVVVLSYGNTEAFHERLLTSLTLMGEILGRQERAAAVTDYIRGIRNDLEKRTGDIPDVEKKTVYLGCQSNYGVHGIGSSTAGYSLFDAVHAKNVLDLNGYTGYQNAVDPEALLAMNPDVILLDAGGIPLLREEYAEKRALFDAMKAFRSGELYCQLPYNAYYINLELAYANAYFIGKVLYPERFADLEPAAKAGEIMEFLLGENCYDDVAASVGAGYGKLDPASLLKK